MPPKTRYDTVSEIAKRRGFYWPSFEIYGGMSGFVTYGDLGTKLKRKVEARWKEYFVRKQGFLEIDDPVLNPEKVFLASGHLENFKEYSVACQVGPPWLQVPWMWKPSGQRRTMTRS